MAKVYHEYAISDDCIKSLTTIGNLKLEDRVENMIKDLEKEGFEVETPGCLTFNGVPELISIAGEKGMNHRSVFRDISKKYKLEYELSAYHMIA